MTNGFNLNNAQINLNQKNTLGKQQQTNKGIQNFDDHWGNK